jgi:hypothetical protein
LSPFGTSQRAIRHNAIGIATLENPNEPSMKAAGITPSKAFLALSRKFKEIFFTRTRDNLDSITLQIRRKMM